MSVTVQNITEDLRKAAAKLREMAKETSRGPWHTGDCELYPRWILSVGEADEYGYAADVIRIHEEFADELPVSDADWQWMGFASPALAEPLAQWLEGEAHMHELRGNSAEGHTFHALAMARVILGGAE